MRGQTFMDTIALSVFSQCCTASFLQWLRMDKLRTGSREGHHIFHVFSGHFSGGSDIWLQSATAVLMPLNTMHSTFNLQSQQQVRYQQH